METYTKLHNRIIYSSIWSESHPTRLVWITLLAMADMHGEVHAALPGLANAARVTVEEAKIALDKFHAPDPLSSSPEFEGRRIESIDGGWRLLNHPKYRDKCSDADKKRKAAIRQKRFRDNQKQNESVTALRVTNNESNDIQNQTQIQTQIENHPSKDGGTGGGSSNDGIEDVGSVVAQTTSPFNHPDLPSVKAHMFTVADGGERYAEAFFRRMERQRWRDKQGQPINDWQAMATAYVNKSEANKASKPRRSGFAATPCRGFATSGNF